jgi:hypothetical protein
MRQADRLGDEFAEHYCLPALMANALYEDKYPLVSSLSRPLIAHKLVKTAHESGASAVAHGCTGKGNDQLRFDFLTWSRSSTRVLEREIRWDDDVYEAGAQVDDEIGRRQIQRQDFVQFAVGAIIAIGHVTLPVKILGKDLGVFVDAAIQNGRLRQGRQVKILLGTVTQEEDLQVKRPGAHVVVKISQVGVICHRLESSLPAQARPQPFGE